MYFLYLWVRERENVVAISYIEYIKHGKKVCKVRLHFILFCFGSGVVARSSFGGGWKVESCKYAGRIME